MNKIIENPIDLNKMVELLGSTEVHAANEAGALALASIAFDLRACRDLTTTMFNMVLEEKAKSDARRNARGEDPWDVHCREGREREALMKRLAKPGVKLRATAKVEVVSYDDKDKKVNVVVAEKDQILESDRFAELVHGYSRDDFYILKRDGKEYEFLERTLESYIKHGLLVEVCDEVAP